MRISATLVDQWIRFQTDEYAQESELIESIRGEFRPTRKVKCGMAFDSILQDPRQYRKGDFYEYEGIAFPADVLDERCIPLFQEPGLWQPKETKLYDIEKEPVTVVAKVDRLVGAGIEEVKTTWGAFDYDRYAEAHQWRHYLLNFGAQWVRYSVFCWTENSKGEFVLHDVNRFVLYPYPEMENECVNKLAELVAYIKRKGLQSYVADDRPRERKVA